MVLSTNISFYKHTCKHTYDIHYIYVPIYIYTHAILHIMCVCLRSFCACVYVHVSVRVRGWMCACMFVCLFVSLFVCLFVCVSVCLSVSVSLRVVDICKHGSAPVSAVSTVSWHLENTSTNQAVLLVVIIRLGVIETERPFRASGWLQHSEDLAIHPRPWRDWGFRALGLGLRFRV